MKKFLLALLILSACGGEEQRALVSHSREYLCPNGSCGPPPPPPPTAGPCSTDADCPCNYICSAYTGGFGYCGHRDVVSGTCTYLDPASY